MDEKEQELSQKELDALDDALTEIEMLYKSRCVRMPGASNVVVREIPSTKDAEEK